MENSDATREEIASTLTSIPCQLSSGDINDFFSLAHYYASKTPQSFRKVRRSVYFIWSEHLFQVILVYTIVIETYTKIIII